MCKVLLCANFNVGGYFTTGSFLLYMDRLCYIMAQTVKRQVDHHLWFGSYVNDGRTPTTKFRDEDPKNVEKILV